MHTTFINRFIAALIATGAFCLAACTASAGVIFSTQGTLPPPREEVQFNADDLILSGMMIQGITNQTDTIVEFESDEDLTIAGSGQASIEAEDGGLMMLTIGLEGDLGFTGISFNLDAVDDGEVMIMAFTSDGTITEDFDLRQNGVNRFILTTSDGTIIDSVKITSTVDLADVKQVRIKGIIPEPTSLALLGAGGLLMLRRRR